MRSEQVQGDIHPDVLGSGLSGQKKQSCLDKKYVSGGNETLVGFHYGWLTGILIMAEKLAYSTRKHTVPSPMQTRSLPK